MSVRVRHVDKSAFRNYLKKAEECFVAANECLKTKRWNAAVISAVHCGISACDALTVFMLGVRHAGDRHEDAINPQTVNSSWNEILPTRARYKFFLYSFIPRKKFVHIFLYISSND